MYHIGFYNICFLRNISKSVKKRVDSTILQAYNKIQGKNDTFMSNNLQTEIVFPVINFNQFNDKLTIVNLIILSELEKSKSEIRRLIKGSGVRINNQIINDEKLIISEKLVENNTIKISLGKKRHIKVKII